MNTIRKLLVDVFAKTAIVLTAFILSLSLYNVKSVDAKVLDEILSYEITADVLEDASVDLVYNISWKVLDSDSEGPLEWVQIGIPNRYCNSTEALTSTIDSISTKSSGGDYVVIYFDRKYYEGEVVDFSFKINQGNLYQVYPEENVAEYTFTPGWFDNIQVDNMVINWNGNKVIKYEPSSLNNGDYLSWQASLDMGEKYTVEIQYPLDAFAFDLSQHNDSDGGSYEYSEHNLFENLLYTILMIIAFIVIIFIMALPVLIPLLIMYFVYKAATGFSFTRDKKITRTIIEYHEACPNCGGAREQGKEKCEYCGSSMIKSKQEIKEENVADTDKNALKYKTDGEYRYSSDPNKYVRVHVVTVPHVVHTTSSSSSSRGTSHRSSCAHSSCACACACACAGGGRAGCTKKDFYTGIQK